MKFLLLLISLNSFAADQDKNADLIAKIGSCIGNAHKLKNTEMVECLKPNFYKDTQLKSLDRAAFFLSQFSKLSNARVCTKEDNKKFPLHDLKNKAWCADLLGNTKPMASYWIFDEEKDGPGIADFGVE